MKFDEAQQAGARLDAICDQLVISARTLQRWRQGEQVPDDGRITRVYEPSNKLSEQEREQVLTVANAAQFANARVEIPWIRVPRMAASVAPMRPP